MHTKNDVQNMYRKISPTRIGLVRVFSDFSRSQLENLSLNDDLENLFSCMINKKYFYSQIFTRKTRWLKGEEVIIKALMRTIMLRVKSAVDGRSFEGSSL